MPAHDDTHFEVYTEQNRAKHLILQGYLGQYFLALKNQVAWFHYIDGFAGRGKYAGQHLGSPLIALETIQKLGLLGRTAVSLVEENRQYFDELSAAIANWSGAAQLPFPPALHNDNFAKRFGELLSHQIYGRSGRVATFAFVDPCGVDGVSIEGLAKILEAEFGEVLVFFNYDGFNRVAGAHVAGSIDDALLKRILGSSDRVSKFKSGLSGCTSSDQRETFILNEFKNAIKDQTKAQFILPFRFEMRQKNRPSHYLIHCCKHSLGFKLMKDVMSSVSRDSEHEIGKLEFAMDSDRDQFVLIRFDVSRQKEEILKRVRQGPCLVRLFTSEWVSKPDDSFSERDYKKMLLQLEASNQIEIYDKHNANPSPASSRRKIKGEATLGEDYWIRVAQEVNK